MTVFDDEFEAEKPASQKATAVDFPNAAAIRRDFEAVFGHVKLIYANENGKELNTRTNRAIDQMAEITVDDWFAIDAASKRNAKFVWSKD